MQIIQSIQNRIYEIRDERIMLDFDLAELYEVETKALNQAVKRNIDRFPGDFMFRLSIAEWQILRSQIVTASGGSLLLEPQTIMTQVKRNTHITPYAFTEQGISMLSGVLSSPKAINMNIAIMRAFVDIRRVLLKQSDLIIQLKEIKEHLENHDAQLTQVYDAIENILDETAAQRKWDNRQRIGFK